MALTHVLHANARAQAKEIAASNTAATGSKKKKNKCGDAKRRARWNKMIMQAVGPSGGSTLECSMGDGVSMGVTADGVVTGADGCAPVSARHTLRSLALLVGRRARAAPGCVCVSSAPPPHPPPRNCPRAERVSCVCAARTGRSRWVAAASWR